MMLLRIGTRSSRLALWQARRVAELLRAARPDADVRIVELSTHGDESGDRPLPEIGGEGLFTERIERALLDGTIDAAVHSLKDLPVKQRAGLVVASVLDRQEAREALIARAGAKLADLPAGAVVGSSSTRRRAQLLARRPDLVVRPIRGNVETRIAKVDSGQYDATVLAGAGLARLGLAGRVSEWLDLQDFLPAPGQGALAVQCRAADRPVLELLRSIDDAGLHSATDAEREFLDELGCGCSAPVAALAEAPRARTPAGDGPLLEMRARVGAPDGSRTIDVYGSGRDPRALARELAQKARAAGADEILGELRPGSLRGRRVVVTRAAAQAAELCGTLSARGAVPILLPMIRTEPVPVSGKAKKTVADLPSYDWLVFTSANAVSAFMDAFEDITGRVLTAGPGRPTRARIAAVGPATAAALRSRSIDPDLVPDAFNAEALADALARPVAGAAGMRVLFPRAEAARRELAATLRERGAVVDEIPLYRTSAAPIDPEELQKLAPGVDAITFMSGSAVRAFHDLGAANPALAAAAQGALIACIGPSTAEAARECGLPVHVVPDDHTAAGLVDALEKRFARREGDVP